MSLGSVKSWTAVLLAVAVMHAHMAFARTALAPWSLNDLVLAETLGTAKTTWLGKFEDWEKYESPSFKVVRDEASERVFKGAVQDMANNRLDTSSLTHIVDLQELLPEIVSTNNTQLAGPLVPGMKWTSQITSVAAPASWCASDLEMATAPAFDAHPQESYVLSIDGKDATLPVIPTASRGTWKRCYNGKLYQRFLGAPDLLAFMGLEFQTCNPVGKLDKASFYGCGLVKASIFKNVVGRRLQPRHCELGRMLDVGAFATDGLTVQKFQTSTCRIHGCG